MKKSAAKPENFRIHSYYNPPRVDGFDPRMFVDGKEFSHTKQEFKDECDINVIVAQYTGGIAPWNARDPQNAQFLDLVDLPTLREASDLLLLAEERFMAVPAKIRAEFDNDAGKFIEFCQNPANADKMVEMGLATRPEGYVADPPKEATGGTASAKKTPSSSTDGEK